MRSWPPPLRSLIPWTVFAFGGVVLALAVAQMVVSVTNHADEAATQQVRLLGALTSTQVEGALRRDAPVEARAATRGLVNDLDIGLAALVDARDTILDATTFAYEGKHIAQSPLAGEQAMIDRVRVTTLQETKLDRAAGRAIAVFPITLTGDSTRGGAEPASRGGVLVVMEDLRFRRQAARAAVFATSAQAAGLLLVLAFLAWRVLGGVITRRLDRLVTAATRIESGDLSARAAVTGGDEIATLGGAFDRMATRLEAGTAALTERETRFRRLVEFGSDIVLTLAADGSVLYLGASARRLFGWDAERITGAHVLSLVHPEDVPRLRPAIDAVLREPGFTEPMLVRVRAAGGRWATIEAICHNPGDLESGERVIVNARDASQRAELEQELRQAQKMEAVGRLAGGVAHDFNNLLTVILAGSENLADRVDAESREEVREMMDAARRAAVLTQQLMTFSRRTALRLEVIDIGEAITGMQGLVRRLIAVDIELAVTVEGARMPVLADVGQLTQVVLNLAANAKDAMPNGGRLTISVRREAITAVEASRRHPLRAGDHVALRVADTGVGMDEATIARIFEPFFTTKPEGRGTGLGLATSYGIVAQLGGCVEVASALHEGTTFTILLPVHNADAPTPPPPPVSAAPRGTERLLIVEDDDALRTLVARMATRLGYRVQTAPHGVDALARLERETFDAVFTDVRMPQMNGIQFAAEARTRWPRLHFIFSSGFTADGADLDAALAQGGVFLPKPFSETELATALRSAIGPGSS